MEWNKIIVIKIKEKHDIITAPPTNSPCPHGLTAYPLPSGQLSLFSGRVGLSRSIGVSVVEVLFKVEIVVSLLQELGSVIRVNIISIFPSIVLL